MRWSAGRSALDVACTFGRSRRSDATFCLLVPSFCRRPSLPQSSSDLARCATEEPPASGRSVVSGARTKSQECVLWQDDVSTRQGCWFGRGDKFSKRAHVKAHTGHNSTPPDATVTLPPPTHPARPATRRPLPHHRLCLLVRATIKAGMSRLRAAAAEWTILSPLAPLPPLPPTATSPPLQGSQASPTSSGSESWAFCTAQTSAVSPRPVATFGRLPPDFLNTPPTGRLSK